MFDEADADDARCLGWVRPKGWAAPVPAERYGLVVIGGGPAGLVAAFSAAGLGVRVALVERGALGGDCLLGGCVPSKAFLAAASSGFTEALGRARAVRADLSVHDSAARLRDAGVDVFFASARFAQRDVVHAGPSALRFARCLIATGSRATRLPWMAAAPDRIVTHEGFFALREAPRSVIVVGGGVVGCELSQGLARAGIATTLLTRGPLLEREARDAVEVVKGALLESGVTVRQGEVRAAARVGEDVVLALVDGGQLSTSHVLVAVGRETCIEGLDLGAAGIAVDTGRLRLDAFLRTTNPAVFAAGDVAGLTPSTHAADAMARRVLSNAFFLPAFRFDPDTVPRTVLTRPELASVGVQAAAPGITAVDVPYQALDRQRCEGRTEGFARLWVDRRGRIRGATFVGEGAVDLLAGVLVAMRGVRTVGGLASLVVPYPTRAEVLRKLGDAWFKARWRGWLAWCVRAWLRLRLGPGSVRR